MKAEYDFSKGERGKFYHPDVAFSFPIYLEPDVNAYLNCIAEEKHLDLQALVNKWLHSNIKIAQVGGFLSLFQENLISIHRYCNWNKLWPAKKTLSN